MCWKLKENLKRSGLEGLEFLGTLIWEFINFNAFFKKRIEFIEYLAKVPI